MCHTLHASFLTRQLKMLRLTEQICMMEEMLQLQSKIRTKKENQRIFKTGQSEKYTNIFKPITSTLEKLKPPPPPPVAQVPPPPPPVKIEREESDEEYDTPKEEFDTDTEESDTEVEEGYRLYDSVLQTIPEALRSDGVFGLKVNRNNPHVGQIGGYAFQVIKNNKIDFYSASVENPRQATIHDPNLWALLLVKNPNSIDLQMFTSDGEYMSYVKHYM